VSAIADHPNNSITPELLAQAFSNLDDAQSNSRRTMDMPVIPVRGGALWVDRFFAFIAGQWKTSNTEFEVHSPGGQMPAFVADCGTHEAIEAVEAAVEAFDTWRKVTPNERSRILRAWHDLIVKNKDEIGATITREMGKPINEAKGEALYAATYVEWYAEEAKRIYGETFIGATASKRQYALRQPTGPVYAITPWNFPAAMATRKAAPALAAGCTVILKPAEQSPLTALLLAKYWEHAGGPAGTFQVLPAKDPVPVSKVMFADRRIRKLTFTGSTEVGRLLAGESAKTFKKVSLELGGHAPFLIFEDADIDAAVKEVMASKFRNAGQTCVCANRIYVHESIADTFAEKLAAATERLVVGDPRKETTEIGPLVDEQALAKVIQHVQDAVAKGARVICGGKPGTGTFFQPTVLANVNATMQIMREETFGPVAPVATFSTEAEAIRLANDTPYGLAAYLWTNDLSRSHRVSEALEYGIVGINDGAPSSAQAPFGGVKDSGLGREGGPWGLQEFLDIKYVSVNLTSAP
jgi:succinate-semialdehyde dehydrogenase / glutarate-semialdehyde dehydrogenase